MSRPGNAATTQQLQAALIAFLVLTGASLIAIYVAAPQIYTATLKLSDRGADTHPLPATLFMLSILAFEAVLVVGTLRR